MCICLSLQINDHSVLGQVAKLPLCALILLSGQAGFSGEGAGIDKSRTQEDIITWPLSFDLWDNRIIVAWLTTRLVVRNYWIRRRNKSILYKIVVLYNTVSLLWDHKSTHSCVINYVLLNMRNGQFNSVFKYFISIKSSSCGFLFIGIPVSYFITPFYGYHMTRIELNKQYQCTKKYEKSWNLLFQRVYFSFSLFVFTQRHEEHKW